MAPLVESGLIESGGQYIGAASHLISAAMQTAGIYFQSDVLSQLVGDSAAECSGSTCFFKSFAVLLFMCSAAAGVLTYAVFGTSKRVLMLLICPSIFFWMLYARVPAGATILRVGERVAPDGTKAQERLLEALGDADIYKQQPQISFFFAKFDNLISSSVQTIVNFLIDTPNGEDLVNVAREKAFQKTFNASSQESGFVGLVSYGLMGACAEYSQQLLNLKVLNEQINDNGARFTAADKADLENQRTAVTNKISQLEKIVVPLSPALSEYLYYVAKDTLDSMNTGGLVDVNSLLQRPTKATCKEMFEFTRLAAKREAAVVLKQATNNGQTGADGTPYKAVQDELEVAVVGNSGADAQARLTEVIGANLLKNTMTKGPQTTLVDNLLSHGPLDPEKYNVLFNEYAKAEAEGELVGLEYFAGTIPYLQGFLLFLLAGSFPFFCFFLLIPSKMGSFGIWLGCWIWVKSWDIGFAFVTLVREFLWYILHYSTATESLKLNWDDPASVVAFINDKHDSFLGMPTYVFIVSVLTMSVPAITAQMCLGATELLSAVSSAYKDAAQKFGKQHGLSVKRSYATKYENMQKRYTGQKKEAAGEKSMQNGGGMIKDENGKEMFGRWQDSNALQRHVWGDVYKAGFAAEYDQNSTRLKANLAAFTNRSTTGRDIGNSKNLLDNFVNTMNEPIEARSFMDGDVRAYNQWLSNTVGAGSVYNTGNTNKALKNNQGVDPQQDASFGKDGGK